MKVRAFYLLTLFALCYNWPGAVVSAAASAPVVIAELQVRSFDNAAEEFIELYNQGTTPVSVDEWKLEYLTTAGAASDFFVLYGQIAPHSSILLSKAGYLLTADDYFSKSLSDTGGHIRLLNASNIEIDRIGWGTAAQPEGAAAPVPSKGQSLQRKPSGNVLVDTGNNATDFIGADPTPVGGGVLPSAPSDSEDPPEGADDGPTANSACKGVVLSEILANPSGADSAGGEFIELYNPTEAAVPLADCLLQTDKLSQYTFAASDLVQPGAYMAVTLADKLLNSGGKVILVSADTEEIVYYQALQDNEAWAVIDGAWQLTNRPTPGASNLPSLGVSGTQLETTDQPATECPVGKFRNPETNRCKSIAEPGSAPVACKPGQVRNPETNRCRTIASSTLASPKPCASDQERNPQTQRCRKVTTVSIAKECPAGQSRNAETNRCRKDAPPKAQSGTDQSATSQQSGHRLNLSILLGVGLLVMSYGIYEYRHEISQALHKVRQLVPVRPSKSSKQ